MSLVDAFELVRQSRHLVGVAQTFGGLQGLGEKTGPRIEWHPAKDNYDPAVAQKMRVNLVVDGKPQQVGSINLRRAGVELRLYVPATGDTSCYRIMDDLIRRTHLALHEVLKGYGNFTADDGEWMDRESIADGLIGYTQSLTIFVPIWHTLQTATVQEVVTNPT